MHVCAAWNENMEEVVQMLRDDRRIKDDTVVWFCIFANYQETDLVRALPRSSTVIRSSRTPTRRAR